MKNNPKILISIFLCCLLIVQDKIYANEFIFKATEINITDNGNITKTGQGSAYSIIDNIIIDAQSFEYKKNASVLNAISAIAVLSEKNIKIKADKLIYDKKIDTMWAIGNVEINELKNDIIIKSENITYQIKERVIESEVESTFTDKFGNDFITQKLIYTLNNDLIKITDAEVIDIKNNTYYVEKAYLNLLTDKLIGKDISINLSNNYFNFENEPRLKGRTVDSNKDRTIIEKGIFTTCKRNDDCPPWQFLAKEITHDKKKKTINYKGAWLKIYDKPVFYFPKFFHPDPSVKRQSGFLMPSFTSSNSTGSAFNLPYFHVISDNQDLTFSPRLYSKNKILAQSEYRVVTANSKNTIDFSLLNEKNHNSKSHFFSKSLTELDFNYFDTTVLSLELQNTSSDTYLKKYQLESPLINSDTSTLTSSASLSASKEDLIIETDFIVYESLNDLSDGDKYEYIYPNFDIRKDFYSDLLPPGNFNLNSNGFIKNYDTNIFEKIMINDFLFSSYPKFTNNGIKNNYNILLKNINTDSKNSEKYKEKVDTKIATLIEYNSSYPLEKNTNGYKNVLKPIISARYSPNNSKNLRNSDRRINANNIFSLDRIGSNDSVEGGGSLSFGTEFYKTNLSNKEILNIKIANVLKFKEDKNLSINSSLGKKTSDIVGNINFNPNKFFTIDYEFSQDENLKDTNYEALESEFKINNFISTFEYLNQNNTTEKQTYLSNKTVYNLNKTKSFSFETRENKKTKATEFYNLMYEYKNDCLIAAIQYNKDYYTDRDLTPNESIYFKLTIIPFGETKSPSLRK